jgi:ribosomal protein S16
MYYVYIYLDTYYQELHTALDYEFDYRPIYVGKGTGDRMFDHLKGTKNKIFENKIQHWQKNGVQPIIRVLKMMDLEAAAFDLERELICTIGRFDQGKGPLLNLTDGGEGVSGHDPWNKGRKGLYVASEATRAKLSNALRGKPKPKDFGEKVSRGLKGKTKTASHRHALSQANIGKTSPLKRQPSRQSAESHAKAADKRKEWWTPERREAKRAQFVGKKLSNEHKANLALAMEKVRKPHSEETKLKMSEKRRQYWAAKKAQDTDELHKK